MLRGFCLVSVRRTSVIEVMHLLWVVSLQLVAERDCWRILVELIVEVLRMVAAVREQFDLVASETIVDCLGADDYLTIYMAEDVGKRYQLVQEHAADVGTALPPAVSMESRVVAPDASLSVPDLLWIYALVVRPTY